MSASRFTFLTLTLGALSLAQGATAGAQTTAPTSAGDASTTNTTTTSSASTTSSVAQQAATIDPAVRIKQLEDRLAALEKAEAKSRAAAAAAPTVTATRDGLNVKSADNAFSFRLRGYVQSDARFFGAKGPVAPGSSTFLLRRVRPILEATAYKYFGLRIMPDFGNGQVVLYDAYAEAKPNAALNLRLGKFKPPIGLERLQSATDVRFVERGLPTSLVPNRDVGVQLYGDLAGARVQYQVGAFDGAPDAANIDGDQSTGKDVVGRLFFRPFATNPAAPDLGVGVAGSSGTEQGTLTATALPSYRTTGQLALFRYRADGTAPNTVLAEGKRTRISPQGYLYAGPVGVLAEYVRSTQNVRRATTAGTLTSQAWQVSTGWVLTGERESYTGISPNHPLDGTKTGGLGALELVARYGVLQTDPSAFPVFADPATQPRRARAAGVGLNWRLTRGIVFATNYERTQLDNSADATVRSTEHAVLTRLQLGF
ncbi:MAG TPA: porin [Gemmatimonadaceae bacterium]|jgi:phosphate-selective porin OprO/OprP|nr:porin [Gemmatimonadaceae bacterium]